MKVKIKDIALVIGSGLTPLKSNLKYWNSKDIPWLKTDQLGQFEIRNTHEFISELAFKETNIKKWPVNTISVAMYGEGQTRGKVSILKRVMTTNQACCNIVVNDKKAYYKYIYYFLKANYVNLRNLSAGVRRNLNSDNIKNFEVYLPSLRKQKVIGDFLYFIDRKIANNNAISKELESMAKTIYDYWFLQFEFPDKDGKPYKSNGGKMVWNDQLKQNIPEGWKVMSLDNFAHIEKGKLLTAKKTNLKGKYKVVSAGLDFSYHHDQYNRLENTITISASGANAGFVRLWYEKIYANDCTTVHGKNVGETDYIYNFLKSAQDYLFKQARGSAQPHVYPKDIKNIRIIIPSENVMKNYTSLVAPFNKKISIIVKENEKLKSLRDFLLPLLMNGQVTIAD